MQYDWIIDVLTDLKAFAARHGLEALAEQLDDTRLVAATEISCHSPVLPMNRPYTDHA